MKLVTTIFDTCGVDAFYEGKEVICSGLDEEVDDMMEFALIKDNNNVYYLEPDGDCGLNVYKNLSPEEYQEKMAYIENL